MESSHAPKHDPAVHIVGLNSRARAETSPLSPRYHRHREFRRGDAGDARYDASFSRWIIPVNFSCIGLRGRGYSAIVSWRSILVKVLYLHGDSGRAEYSEQRNCRICDLILSRSSRSRGRPSPKDRCMGQPIFIRFLVRLLGTTQQEISATSWKVKPSPCSTGAFLRAEHFSEFATEAVFVRLLMSVCIVSMKGRSASAGVFDTLSSW